MKWQAVFFDFDGVVLDSVHVKTEAFAAMFRSYGRDIEEKVVAYHLANGGVSRYEKLRYFHEQLLKRPVDDSQIERMASEFSDLVLQKVLRAPFIEGVVETLSCLKACGIPAYVVSGTPEEEVRFIVKRRGLVGFFKEVHGSPRTKKTILNDVLFREGFEAPRCLFVGDAMTDYAACCAMAMKFLGIVSASTPSPFPEGTKTSERVVLNVDQ